MTPTVKEGLLSAERRLAAAGVDSPGIDAELLLGHVLGIDRLALYTNPERCLTDEPAAEYEALLRQREEGRPLQWLTGRQEFMSLEISLDPGVFIPRPETEILVEEAMPLAAAVVAERGTARLLEVGTGSGAIAVAMAFHVPGVHVRAFDISSLAVGTARRNVFVHGLTEAVEVVEADPLQDGGTEDAWSEADIVLSNPPYIPSADIGGLQREVRDYEPLTALDGGTDGLDCYRRIVLRAALMRPGARLLVECGQGQSREIALLMEAAGMQVERIVPDYAGIERVVTAVRPLG